MGGRGMKTGARGSGYDGSGSGCSGNGSEFASFFSLSATPSPSKE